MEPFIGQVIMFAGNFAPRGWALCEGQLLPINQNDALFSILGTTYGGDGRTTFGLPDLRGRAPVQQGTGPGLSPINLGQKKGAEQTTLLTSNLPATPIHIPASEEDANSNEASGKVAAVTTGNSYASPDGSQMKAGSLLGVANTSYTNMQPSIACNYIIALVGVYPSRT